MSAEFFLDTNLFVYHLDASDPAKQAKAEHLIRRALEQGDACISFQVVQECLNVMLRKAQVRLSPEQARAYLDAVLLPLVQVPARADLYHRALDLQSRWQLGFYDALIVAGALQAGCTSLLSEDMQHGQRIESLTILNPFV